MYDDKINPIPPELLKKMIEKIERKSHIDLDQFWKYGVKRGLRNPDGSGVMAGLTNICSVEGYYMEDGERVPKPGVLKYRGVNINDIVEACERENRFGFEEVAYLLIFGSLPTKEQVELFAETLGTCRELPKTYIEDVLMKNASIDIMNKLARCVLISYSFDENPDDISIENVLRQSIQILAQLPVMMCYAYQVKRMKYYGKSMYFHPEKKELSTAETILRSIRADRKYTDEEAKLLDICLILHAEHGGGNNSTFTTRVLTSSGTDSYSAFAGAIGSLKGIRHGGANIRVSHMLDDIREHVDITDEDQIEAYLEKIIRKEAGDGTGLVYGMGHAVYTLSDPRAVILKRKAKEFAYKYGYEKEFEFISSVEKLTPEAFRKVKGKNKIMCANVDLYSGFIYKMLKIPEDLYTPIFASARMAGWSAHRLEELISGKKIIRPAYKNIALPKKYVNMADRIENYRSMESYVPSDQRVYSEGE
ncbi:MAG: citrate synthase [Oscillospiraceae bacterium]|nr:citrate synthase [Oscillospiraceae bacterium]MDD6145762.1 citrate synthase [Oscillospiraceae bacterium]